MKSNGWITWKSIGILKNFMVGGNVVTSAAMNFEDDGRLQYLCNYVCVSMKVKAEKWVKLLMTDEHRYIVTEWLNDSSKRILLISSQASGYLVPSLGFPTQLKGKSCYFVKIHSIDLTVQNILTNVLCGDVSSKTVECLSSLVDEVVYPLLSSTFNRQDWPEVIVKDIDNQIQSIRSTIAEVKGTLVNKTILPIPVGNEEILSIGESVLTGDHTALTLQMKNKLEGMVIKWCHQIDSVINTKPVSMSLNPVPSDEYKYWQLRHENLENIHSQVTAQGINTILMILKSIDSVYYSSFHSIFQRTVSSLNEARDIRVYVSALSPRTEKFETTDFNMVRPLIQPLMHCIGLTWANSTYYNAKDHWTRYFLMICNLLIRESGKHLDSSSLFQGDSEESLSRMQETIDILESFKLEVLTTKSKLHIYKKPETNPIPWSFQAKTIFKRLNLYIQRLNDIRDIFQTANEFSKLDRMEMGGIKGRNLSRRITDASLEYQKLYSQWNSIDFDTLDADGTAVVFEKIQKEYRENADRIERSLAQVFIEAFDDCYSTAHCFQLIEMAGTLFDSKIIRHEIRGKYTTVLDLYKQEMETVNEIFESRLKQVKEIGLRAIPVDKCLPNVSGALKWAFKLRMRLTAPLVDLEFLDSPIFQEEKGQQIMERKCEIEARLLDFEKETFEQWKMIISSQIPLFMGKTLLRRSSEKLLILNFDETLVAALREIKILKSDCWNSDFDIPAVGEELFQLDEPLWQSRIMLSRIVEWYNFLRTETQECEYHIISSQIDKIDTDLEDAIKVSTWLSYRPGYLKYVYDNIYKIHKNISTVQGNVKTFLKSISDWSRAPLYKRKSNNRDSCLDILDAENQMQIQNDKIDDTKDMIQRSMLENFNLFFNIDDDDKTGGSSCKTTTTCNHNLVQKKIESMRSIGKGSDELGHKAKKPIQSTQSMLNITKQRTALDSQLQLFEPYERYIDQLISTTIIDSIYVSISYIKSEMIANVQDIDPLLSIRIELHEKGIRFSPSLKPDADDGLLTLMKNILENIFHTADSIPRIFQPHHPTELRVTFKDDLLNNTEIEEMKMEILSMVEQTIAEVEECVHIFKEYEHIWLDDKQECLDREIKVGGNYFAINESDLLNDIKLQKFKDESFNIFSEQIDKWDNMYNEIDQMESYQIFNKWLRLDVTNFKQALLNECCKWGNMFKQQLIQFLNHNLNYVHNFIENGMETLQLNVTMEQNSTLLTIMSILNQIIDRNLDDIFDSLRDVMNLLQQYNVELDDSIGIRFAELPDKWYHLKKRSILIQEKIAPIKANQVNAISKRISAFEHKIAKFRDDFKKAGFFQETFDSPYELCSTMHHKLVFLEVELKKLNDSATLFHLSAPTSTNHVVETCRREIRLVKKIWDFVYVVESCVDDWKKTAWKRLDVEEMEQVCKKFTKDVRSLGKTVRHWQPFLHVEQLLKNLQTSLRAITELQNTAIRDRHWNELMQSTGVNIRTKKSTTLRELLSLNLHLFEEDVKITVDKAVKEMAMEKTLNDIGNVWNNMEFEYETHQRSDLQLLKVSEELIETLEENQVQIQNMSTSKYIGYFEAEFAAWRTKLSNADQIVNIWSEVQRKWTYLESIFTQSEDIRRQLPDDSERFDEIDRNFRIILSELTQSKNVMIVTNQCGLYERIEVALSGLILCEKALNDYLETKRLAYPRFYFISPADLLDILSHGTEPKIVGRHLTKLYDSIMKLHYPDGSKIAVGMYSKENEEYVEFCTECPCTGNVEIWLNEVTLSMRSTLHKLFATAVVEYEDKVRESWIFDWPAQVGLCITQIWWSIEVNEALRKQQQGYENALKDYQKKQINQLNALISLLLGELTVGDRQKIMTICTIDVHSRECVAKMIAQRVENATAFQWQSQLRHRWDYEQNDCFANICDAQFKYDYEYLGNTPRLVITPLTDRCYVTLTQSLHLIMGGAPAGPAGTGKTETTKDLGKGLGVMVYVFNCSEQMDYRSCGNIYKGLAQTGAWGCFDEFNRISIEVLSVVAVQVKCIQDAIKTKKTKFMFMGECITLTKTIGLFITMNPGYLGRTELRKFTVRYVKNLNDKFL